MEKLSQQNKIEKKPKVTCFHDGDCPICNIEIKAMKKLDKGHKINWVDFSKDKNELTEAGITYQQAMNQLHVIDENQQICTGVIGFLQVWKQLPYYRRLAPMVETIPLLLPIMEFFYRIFARYRLQLTGKKTD